MNRRFILVLLTTLGLTSGAFAAAAPAPSQVFGVVNFGTCVSDSKFGKQEQASFESIRKQMTTLLEDTEKQLNDMNAKFNDPEYLDGLSPTAVEELKVKFQNLSEEHSRYQNQYYQVLNQANMRIYQVIANYINTASEKIAKEKKLMMVINKEACFSYSPQLDITNLIIAEMDKVYDEEAKKHAVNQEASSAVKNETAALELEAPAGK